jgi:hypothetical protein
MTRDRWLSVLGLRTALVLTTMSSLGCFAHSRGELDWDEKPVVNMGAGATIIYPGQSAPVYMPPGSVSGAAPGSGQGPPPPGTPVQSAPGSPPHATSTPVPSGAPPSYGSAPTVTIGPNGEQYSGSAAPGGPPITMIGGAEKHDKGHLSWKEEPLWWKYLALPFAAIAAPFKAAAEAARGEPEPGPEVPQTGPEVLGPETQVGTAPSPARTDYETAMVDRLEHELDSRQRETTAGAPGVPPLRTPVHRGASGERPLSIREELAALQRTPGNAPPPRPSTPQGIRPGAPSTPSARARTAQPPEVPQVADGIVDRDGDGRVDQWIFRENGEISRVELDETRDGRPDRTLYYDLETHQICRVEEDGNADGVSDSWTDYENGQVVRRRGDGDRDGTVDTWSFYRDGAITRHERDTTVDGFRDRVATYEGGKMIREERDRDRDGRPDATILYDAEERVARREEDNDGDGRPDVITYYEAGRLARRELLQHEAPPKTARP